MDDEGDFKKTRGFLLTYSALVLALWFFGADLTQFKLMGNEVKLNERTESAWLVLSLVNIYFWFRCYQRVPTLGLYFDGPMNDLYDRALVWAVSKLKRRAINRSVQEHFTANFGPDVKMRINPPSVEATGRRTVQVEQNNNAENASELRRLSRADRAAVTLYAAYAIWDEGVWKQFAGYGRVTYKPNALITWPLKAYVIIRGAFVTPWFTDHIAPLLLGGVSTALALWKWYEVKLSTSVIHTAAACIN